MKKIIKKKNKKEPRPFSWINPKLEVKDTEKYGKGIFAKKDIKKDDMLIVMGGYILTLEDDNELSGSIADKPIDLSDCFMIGPRNHADLKRMPQHYVNHSCEPNIGFKGQIFMVAMKNIKMGDEIFYDYAMVMYPDKSGKSNCYFKMECKCGSKKCRGTITEDDWEIPKLQRDYKGYFQWFVQDKIEKNKKHAKNLKIKKNKSYQLKSAPWEKNKK